MTKISVVTGGSGGIGRAVARKLAARGEAVAVPPERVVASSIR